MNIRKSSAFLVVLFVLAGRALLWSKPPQTSAHANAQDSDVILTITAVDTKGDPVADLTASDFRVLDEGKEKQFTDFRSPSEKPVAETPPGVTVILYDLLNSSYSTREYDITFMDRALESLEVADNVYLYFLTNRGEFYPIHAFPPAREMVFHPTTRAAKDTGSVVVPPWTRQIHDRLELGVQSVYGFRTDNFRDDGYRATTTFTALAKIHDAFKQFPGAKTMVWITTGVPNRPDYPYGCKDISIVEPAGSYVAGKCTNRCEGAYKCVDYEPFLQHFTMELEQTNTVLDVARNLPIGNMPSTERGTSEDTLNQLVNLNGGKLYDGTKIDEAITAAIKNSRGRYQLKIAGGFANGKYHKLKVTCSRQGVKLNAPRGYWTSYPGS